MPRTECLKDTVSRFLPYWQDQIVPQIKVILSNFIYFILIAFFVLIKNGKRVLIAAHGNSLRALIKYLDKVPDNEIVELNIPTGKLILSFKSLNN